MGIYPKLKVDLNKFRDNYRAIRELCQEQGIQVAFVIKGCNGLPKIAKVAIEEGAKIIGTSRLKQFKNLGDLGEVERLLLRIPMASEIDDVIRYSDISLASDIDMLNLLNQQAKLQKTQHQVILMADLGDLREGFWQASDLIDAALVVENNMKYLELAGIGTNLGCYGAIKSTPEKMNQLLDLRDQVENAIGRKLKYVSGGQTTALPLVYSKEMPKGINMLRVGEAILLGRDMPELFNCPVKNTHNDVFVLESQLAEIKEKPSYPVGEIVSDCFGLVPDFKDKGMILHGIVGAGKVDYGYSDMLVPMDEGVEILGASSDHTILDLTNVKNRQKLKVGDVLRFRLSYANIVHLCSKGDLNIEYVE